MGRRGDSWVTLKETDYLTEDRDASDDFLQVFALYYDRLFKILIYVTKEEVREIKEEGLNNGMRRKISETVISHIESVLNDGKQRSPENRKRVNKNAIRIYSIGWNEEKTLLKRRKV